MEVFIMDAKDGFVQAKTEFGSFYGIWMSDLPANTSYLVELSCNAVSNMECISLSNHTQPAIYDDGAYTVINGFVEEIEDSVMFLRLQDSIVMIEICCDIDVQAYTGQWVTIRVEGMKIYHVF